MKICKQCPKPTMGAGCITCGASECQQAEYEQNKARLKRKKNNSL